MRRGRIEKALVCCGGRNEPLGRTHRRAVGSATMPMTLMDAKPLKPKRGIFKYIPLPLFIIILAAIAGFVTYSLWNYPEERAVSRFLTTLEKGDYRKAYQLWNRRLLTSSVTLCMIGVRKAIMARSEALKLFTQNPKARQQFWCWSKSIMRSRLLASWWIARPKGWPTHSISASG